MDANSRTSSPRPAVNGDDGELFARQRQAVTAAAAGAPPGWTMAFAPVATVDQSLKSTAALK
jgi:hypothetical protein